MITVEKYREALEVSPDAKTKDDVLVTISRAAEVLEKLLADETPEPLDRSGPGPRYYGRKQSIYIWKFPANEAYCDDDAVTKSIYPEGNFSDADRIPNGIAEAAIRDWTEGRKLREEIAQLKARVTELESTAKPGRVLTDEEIDEEQIEHRLQAAGIKCEKGAVKILGDNGEIYISRPAMCGPTAGAVWNCMMQYSPQFHGCNEIHFSNWYSSRIRPIAEITGPLEARIAELEKELRKQTNRAERAENETTTMASTVDRLRAIVIKAANMLEYGEPEPPDHVCGGPNSCCDSLCQEHATWWLAVCEIRKAAEAAGGKSDGNTI